MKFLATQDDQRSQCSQAKEVDRLAGVFLAIERSIIALDAWLDRPPVRVDFWLSKEGNQLWHYATATIEGAEQSEASKKEFLAVREHRWVWASREQKSSSKRGERFLGFLTSTFGQCPDVTRFTGTVLAQTQSFQTQFQLLWPLECLAGIYGKR